MSRNLLFKFIIIGIGAFLWMSHSAGRASDKNQGNTGAPGDAIATCASSGCHVGTAISVSLDIEVLDGTTAVTEYVPGETYTVNVRVNHTGGNSPVAFGFQLVALTDADEQSTESFTNPSANTQLATASSTGRLYAEHNGPSSSNLFSTQWTAPVANSGSVTFYAAGNGVNGNGMSSGDGADNTSLTINEDNGTPNVNLIAEKWDLTLFPNPVQDEINLSVDNNFDGRYTATIIDVAGRTVRSQNIQMEGGRVSLSSSDLTTGNYALMLQNENETAVIKFSKL